MDLDVCRRWRWVRLRSEIWTLLSFSWWHLRCLVIIADRFLISWWLLLIHHVLRACLLIPLQEPFAQLPLLLDVLILLVIINERPLVIAELPGDLDIEEPLEMFERFP